MELKESIDRAQRRQSLRNQAQQLMKERGHTPRRLNSSPPPVEQVSWRSPVPSPAQASNLPHQDQTEDNSTIASKVSNAPMDIAPSSDKAPTDNTVASLSVPDCWLIHNLPETPTEFGKWFVSHFANHLFLQLPPTLLTKWLHLLQPHCNAKMVQALTPTDFISALGAKLYVNNIPQLVELNIVFSFIQTQVLEQRSLPLKLTDYVTFRQQVLEDHGQLLSTPHGLFYSPRNPASSSNAAKPQTLSPTAPPYEPISPHVHRDKQSLKHQLKSSPSHGSYHTTSPGLPDYGEEQLTPVQLTEGGIQGTHGTPQTVPMDMDDTIVPREVNCPGGAPDPSDHFSKHSLESRANTMRTRRNLENKAQFGSVKTRGFIGSDKLKWKDGTAATFAPFEKDVEGTIMKLGMGYLLNEDVQQSYKAWGPGIALDPTFYAEFGISFPQFKHDIEHLYGILLSATKDYDNPNILRNKSTRDGLLTWLGLIEDNGHLGSTELKEATLEDNIAKPYDPKAFKSIADYLDKFHSWTHQLEAIASKEDGNIYSDAFFKKRLLKNLSRDISLLPLIRDCKKNRTMTMMDSVVHIKQHAMFEQAAIAKATMSPSMRRLHLAMDITKEDEEEDEDDTVDTAMDTIQQMVEQEGIVVAYNTLKQERVRESLFIPQAVWKENHPSADR